LLLLPVVTDVVVVEDCRPALGRRWASALTGAAFIVWVTLRECFSIKTIDKWNTSLHLQRTQVVGGRYQGVFSTSKKQKKKVRLLLLHFTYTFSKRKKVFYISQLNRKEGFVI
jgi:hypothetical protein